MINYCKDTCRKHEKKQVLRTIFSILNSGLIEKYMKKCRIVRTENLK